MLSQFSDRGTLAGGGEGARTTLSDYIDVPGAYPAGGSIVAAMAC